MLAKPLFRHAASWMTGLAETCAATAFAQDWYGVLHAGKGWKSPADMEFSITANVPAVGNFEGGYEAELDYDSGLGVGVALGRAFGNGQLEGELGYRTSKIGGFEAPPATVKVNGVLRF